MIIRNRARCRRCGEIDESTHRHDFVRCTCGAVAVDGGKDCLRRIGFPEYIEELSEEIENPNKKNAAHSRERGNDFDGKPSD